MARTETREDEFAAPRKPVHVIALLPAPAAGRERRILLFGAHSDDIEIGLGGTILAWLAADPHLRITWCVASGAGARGDEAYASASSFLQGSEGAEIVIGEFADTLFPAQMPEIKRWMAAVGEKAKPDVVFTHRRADAHQDHRTLAELAGTIFRDHLTLEYEIPKWDGDLGQPNVYVPLPEGVLERKIELLDRHFATQRGKDWFDAETFRGLARLRGMECRAASRYAEAMLMRKSVIAFG